MVLIDKILNITQSDDVETIYSDDGRFKKRENPMILFYYAHQIHTLQVSSLNFAIIVDCTIHVSQEGT